MITFPLNLLESFFIAPKVKHFICQIADSLPFSYIPGQFITIHFTDQKGHALKRSYSIANAPHHDNRIEFTASYVEGGAGSYYLFNLMPGDKIQASGPFGRLVLKEAPYTRYLLVATGTGITPYRAMRQELEKRLQNNARLEVAILQGVRTREDMLFGDEFKHFAQSYPNVSFRAYLSRQAELDLRDFEYKGYVQQAFEDLFLNPEKDLVYLCGNPGMIDGSFEILKNKGFSVQQIIREKYFSLRSNNNV